MPTQFLNSTRHLMESLLAQALRTDGDVPTKLTHAVEYSCLDGGKRFRPALLLASGRCCAVADDRLHPLMVAVEMLHCFSLVHDDLPCMDDDDMRRGRPSTHARFGEADALLAGDALMMMSFEHVLASTTLTDGNKVTALSALAAAAGASGMIGGQLLDMHQVGQRADAATLSDIHRRKTGALILCCCALPVELRPHDQSDNDHYRQCLTNLGTELGVGFQIVDDILDVVMTTAALGKPAGSDREQGHYTYVSLLGLDGARLEAQKRHLAALKALESFDTQADPLRELVDLVFARISSGEI